MLYTQNLEDLIFYRHESHEADELIIISGYIGPQPVERLNELPFNCSVVYGMYGEDGIQTRLHNPLLTIQNNSDNINIYYSTLPVHSKCYVWKRENQVVHALIGSANFSINGLCTPYRETLAETTVGTYRSLNQYITRVLNNSISCLDLEEHEDRITIQPAEDNSCTMTLLSRNGEVGDRSGLNWGLSDGHTMAGDCYIAIRAPYVREFPHLFPPKQTTPSLLRADGRSRRDNEAIEIIWDDGITMSGLLEGSQTIDDIVFPKNLSSFPDKTELGIYLRNRIGVSAGQPVRRMHLDRYGRTDIRVSLVSEGVYYFDFSI